MKPEIVVALWQEAGLPVPLREYRFHPVRRWRFDYAFLAQKVAVEVDGGIWVRGRHSGGSGQLKDMEKMNSAVLAGWRVLHFTPQQVLSRDAFAMLQQLLQ